MVCQLAKHIAVASIAIIATTLASPALATSPPVKLKMAQIEINAANHLHINSTELLAFIPTKSHGLCLVTLAESNFPISGTTAFCGIREVDGVEGVVIHVFLPEAPPPEALWLVNIYQVGARRYGPPTACTASC